MVTHHLDFPTYFLLLLFITPSKVLIHDSPLLVQGSYSIFCFNAVLIIKQFLFIYKKVGFFICCFSGKLLICLFVCFALAKGSYSIYSDNFPWSHQRAKFKNISCQEGQVPLRRHRRKVCPAYDKQEDRLWREYEKIRI